MDPAGRSSSSSADDELERPAGSIDHGARGLTPDVRLVVPEIEFLAQASDAAELGEVAHRPGIRDRGARVGRGAWHGDQARGARSPAEVDLRGAFALAVGEIQGIYARRSGHRC